MKFLLPTALLLTSTAAFHSPISITNQKGTSLHQSTIDQQVSPGANIKYPTLRGSEVDSRKIVSEPLLALRVGHVLFAGEELARQVSLLVWNYVAFMCF
jgi:hypothetical protein